MRTIMIGPLMAGFVIVGAWMGCAQAAEEAAPAAGSPATPASDAAKAAPAAGAAGECCKAGDTTPPLDLIKAVPKGGLHNPYKDKVAEIARERFQAVHQKLVLQSAIAVHVEPIGRAG